MKKGQPAVDVSFGESNVPVINARAIDSFRPTPDLKDEHARNEHWNLTLSRSPRMR